MKEDSDDPVFPPELFDEIAGHLAYDKKTLKILCCVSRAFVPGCQRLIFAWQKLRLHHKHGNASKMLKFFMTKPRFATYTRHLTLLDDEEPEDSTEETVDTREILLGQLLPLFQDLKRLSFSIPPNRGRRWNYDVSPKVLDLYIALLGLPSLTHVDFGDVPLALMHYLPSSIKYLTLKNPFLNWTPTSPVDLSAITEIHLSTLLIDGVSYASCAETGEIIQWILQCGLELWSLREFGVNLSSAPLTAHDDVAKVLQQTPLLEVLSITPSFTAYNRHEEDFQTDAIDLSVLPMLHFLHVSTEVGFSHNASGDIEPLLWLLPLLKKLPPSNSLQTLAWSTEYDVYETTDDKGFFGHDFDAFTKLQSLLVTEKRCPRLKKVILCTEAERNLPAQKIVKWANISIFHRVPKLVLKGLTKFEFGVMFRRKLFASTYRWKHLEP